MTIHSGSGWDSYTTSASEGTTADGIDVGGDVDEDDGGGGNGEGEYPEFDAPDELDSEEVLGEERPSAHPAE
jgi:hypothetical protein